MSREQLMIGSARSSGMGGMTTILEEGTTALWWNPGMLGFDPAVRLNWTYVDLTEGLPEYFNDPGITLRTFAVHGPRLGFGDLRFVAGAGHTYLDLGNSDVINSHGQLIREYHSRDRLYNLAAAVCWKDWAGAGIAYEFTDSKLLPSIPELGIEGLTASVHSLSFGAAISPKYYLDENEGGFRRFADGGGLLFNPVIGVSFLHIGQKVQYCDDCAEEDLPRQFHAGAGIRFGYHPGLLEGVWNPRRLLRSDVLLAYEYDKSIVGDKDVIHHAAVEIRMLGFFSARAGRVTDREGLGIKQSHGFGFGVEGLLPVDVRVDWASFPRYYDYEDREHWEVTVALDPALLGW